MASDVMTRADARAQGLKRYYSGRPCKFGHFAERQVSSLNCMECNREKKAARWPFLDKEKVRAARRLWQAANREKLNAKSREMNKTPETKARRAAWFQANKVRIRDKRRAEYAKNPAERLSYNRAWIEANPERFAEHMRIHARKRRAQKHKSNGAHTAADIAAILNAQGGRCVYCRANLKRAKKNVDHILPLALGGSNDRRNLQVTCRPCNQSKSAKHPLDFARERGLLL